MSNDEYDVVIAGGGVAGLTAGLTSARAGRKTRVLTGPALGGHLVSIERIDGYPGFPDGVPGYDLCPIIQEQAAGAGAEFAATEATGLHAEDGRWRVTTGEGDVRARAVVIATGTTLKTLGIPGEEPLRGKGVSHCASCDAPLLRGRIVGVVGGGDSALQEALTLAQHAARVIILHRGSAFSAQAAYVEQVRENPKIEVRFGTIVEEAVGNGGLTGVRTRTVGMTGRPAISSWPVCSCMSDSRPQRRCSTVCSRSMHRDGSRSMARCAAACPVCSRRERSAPGRPGVRRRPQATARSRR